MKTMWITTGLVIGIGIAATVAATDGTTPSRIVPAEVVETGDSTNIETTTTVAVADSTSTSTTAAVIRPFVSVPATTPNASPPAATTTIAAEQPDAAPATTIVEIATSTTRPWNTPGTACGSPGDLSWDSDGQHQLICTDGVWQVKQ